MIAAAAWPFRPRARAGEHAAHGPAIAAVAIALALLAIAGISHSEHLLTDRDPAVYINTGRSIARTHRIRPAVAASPFDDARAFHAADRRASRSPTTGCIPNFLHFLPALLALGWSAGGDTGLLLVPALLGALGAARAVRARLERGRARDGPLLGPVLLALAPLQSWFARDAYAELPLAAASRSAGSGCSSRAARTAARCAGAIAGVVLGSIMFVRIDALAILVAIPAALAIEYLRAERARAARPGAGGAGAICRVRDRARASRRGSASRVSQRAEPRLPHRPPRDLHQLELALRRGPRRSRSGSSSCTTCRRYRAPARAEQHRCSGRGASLTLAIAVYAYHVPAADRRRAVARHGRSPTRKVVNAFYFSSSFRWFAWYLGIVRAGCASSSASSCSACARCATDSPAFLLLAAARAGDRCSTSRGRASRPTSCGRCAATSRSCCRA